MEYQRNKHYRLRASQYALIPWLLRRFLRGLALWMIACFVLYLLLELLPGDAATQLVGKDGPEAVQKARAEMGLDQPWLMRYISWLRGLLQGDLGHSLASRVPVARLMAKPLLATLLVSGIVVVALILITIPASLLLGYQRSRMTSLVSAGAITISALPEFVTGIIMMGVLCIGARILPVLSVPGPNQSVWDRPITLVLPALILWLTCSAGIFRRVRAMVSTYASSAYVREAELAGLSHMRVLCFHLLPTIRGGIGQLLAQNIPYLLGGAVVVEFVTSFPGMGLTLTMAIANRETPIIMGICALLMLVFVLFYTFADLPSKSNERITAVL
ncbi:MAG: ABC transporter permease [Tissierellia bacterium]|nr:ABC transporter permease [Tissierellia bacterium]